MQNEMLKVMALEVLRYVAASLHSSPFYSIMAYETTDSSTRERVVICLRWVDNSLSANDEFIGLQQVDKIDAATKTFTIKDVLQLMNLGLTGARGQCYEGCSLCQKSVAINIKSDEPRPLFTQCYGHSLNLTASDSMKASRIMKDALETTHEITKLIKYSPKRDAVGAN